MKDEDIIQSIKSHYGKASTSQSYINRLTSFKKHINKGGEDILYDMLQNPDTYISMINEVYDQTTTRKNIITGVMVIYRVLGLKQEYETEYMKWKRQHDEYNMEILETYKQNIIPDKMAAKYISIDEIKALYKKLLSSNTQHRTLKLSLAYLALSYYCNQKPKRSELGHVRLILDKNDINNTENLLLLRKRNNSYLIINDYKTRRMDVTNPRLQHGPIYEKLSPDFHLDLCVSLYIHPRDYMFIRANNMKPMTNAEYGRFITRTFEKYFNKRVGTSMLRHVYISERVNTETLSISEREKIARQMGHSKGQQELYKWRLASIKDKVNDKNKA